MRCLDAVHGPARSKRWARGWRLEQAFVGVLNRSDEVEPEPFRLSLVEVGCRNELVLCFGMKLNSSHRSVERAF